MTDEIERLFTHFGKTPFHPESDPNEVAGLGAVKQVQPTAFPDLGNFHVTTDRDGVSVKDDADVERVRMGKLDDGDYGLKVVASDGETVIIDGESDMFRISASGTLQLTLNHLSNGVSATVTLTGITATETPAGLHFLSTSSATNANRHLGVIYNALGPQQWYAADSFAGPANGNFQAILHIAEGHTVLGPLGNPRVFLSGHNVSGTNTTVFDRFYVLEQSAI